MAEDLKTPVPVSAKKPRTKSVDPLPDSQTFILDRINAKWIQENVATATNKLKYNGVASGKIIDPATGSSNGKYISLAQWVSENGIDSITGERAAEVKAHYKFRYASSNKANPKTQAGVTIPTVASSPSEIKAFLIEYPVAAFNASMLYTKAELLSFLRASFKKHKVA